MPGDVLFTHHASRITFHVLRFTSPTLPPYSAAMNAAILVAAVRGARMGPGVDKLFLEVAGRPVVAHTLQRFGEAGCIDELVVAVREELQPDFGELLKTPRLRKPFRGVGGGRQP